MDTESARSRELGCWDGPTACSGLVTLAADLTPAPADFEPGKGYYDFLMEIGFGETVSDATREFWAKTIRETYNGDEGKRRICMAAVTLASRDGLHERLPYIKCPVLWLQVRTYTDLDNILTCTNMSSRVMPMSSLVLLRPKKTSKSSPTRYQHRWCRVLVVCTF